MPRSRRYNHLSLVGELPKTVQRSSQEAQAAFRQAREARSESTVRGISPTGPLTRR